MDQRLDVVYTQKASEHLDFHASWYAAEGGEVLASRFITEVKKGLEFLSLMPRASRPGKKLETRQYILQSFPYIIEFRVRASRLEVLALFHQRINRANQQ